MTHVDKDPLHEPKVGLGKFQEKCSKSLKPLSRRFPLAHLLEAGDQLGGEDRIRQLSEEEFEQARNNRRVGAGEVDCLPLAVSSSQFHDFRLHTT